MLGNYAVVTLAGYHLLCTQHGVAVDKALQGIYRPGRPHDTVPGLVRADPHSRPRPREKVGVAVARDAQKFAELPQVEIRVVGEIGVVHVQPPVPLVLIYLLPPFDHVHVPTYVGLCCLLIHHNVMLLWWQGGLAEVNNLGILAFVAMVAQNLGGKVVPKAPANPYDVQWHAHDLAEFVEPFEPPRSQEHIDGCPAPFVPNDLDTPVRPPALPAAWYRVVVRFLVPTHPSAHARVVDQLLVQPVSGLRLFGPLICLKILFEVRKRVKLVANHHMLHAVHERSDQRVSRSRLGKEHGERLDMTHGGGFSSERRLHLCFHARTQLLGQAASSAPPLRGCHKARFPALHVFRLDVHHPRRLHRNSLGLELRGKAALAGQDRYSHERGQHCHERSPFSAPA
mmetsp:Transcript_32420/g.103191  ORF Transcript_32420/g.103191 Transcript_32420/m.103191 type:complete len:397 (-) Transcript_32420:14-1204(-)